LTKPQSGITITLGEVGLAEEGGVGRGLRRSAGYRRYRLLSR